jgi:hypothetical protein
MLLVVDPVWQNKIIVETPAISAFLHGEHDPVAAVITDINGHQALMKTR